MSEIHETSTKADSGGQTVKVAVEGCGHGTLHAIYASVKESCKAKGWDGVDVLIIGGDFQAVRNKLDLNVTAMPVKYRRMADFHEYYSGTRVAPYLTIFVGGNHEASNYLFELYYGGWVAPNIYYMGAANVLRFGPLRIAALSGIWKGYDYNKPHYERLPYNNDDIQSIYHVREVDVRKLLSIRTQVDIGMSHDWPQGIEWAGDHQWLFSKKDLFQADAMSGKLGSVAAKQCLDRLRPKYWFSAHLHIKYAAKFEHGDYQLVRPAAPRVSQVGPRRLDPASDPANPDDKTATSPKVFGEPHGGLRFDRSNVPLQNQNSLSPASRRSENASQLSAWQNFHTHAASEDAAELERFQNEQTARVAEHGETATTAPAPYQIEETWKAVKVDDDLNRNITSVLKSGGPTQEYNQIPNVDGCIESKDARSDLRESEARPIIRPTSDYGSTRPNEGHGEILVTQPLTASASVRNEDEIDVDMDDSSSEVEGAPSALSTGHLNGADDEALRTSHSTLGTEGGVRLSTTNADPLDPQNAKEKQRPSAAQVESHDEMQIEATQNRKSKNSAETPTAPSAEDGITSEMRAELAALSSNFKPVEPVKTSPSLPLPEAISNKVTRFLALDKCEQYRDFLQLLEISPISQMQPAKSVRPFKLEYDPEWLAIQRVFIDELEVGGNPKSSVAPNLGDTQYRDRILEEEKWVNEHVVAANRLVVPENFSQTAPVFDPQSRHQDSEMPREYPNPQTEYYCKLIDIDNKFALSEEEIDQRISGGPRQERENFGRHRGRGGGHHGRGRGGFGGRGGGRGGRGRGRGGNRRW